MQDGEDSDMSHALCDHPAAGGAGRRRWIGINTVATEMCIRMLLHSLLQCPGLPDCSSCQAADETSCPEGLLSQSCIQKCLKSMVSGGPVLYSAACF